MLKMLNTRLSTAEPWMLAMLRMLVISTRVYVICLGATGVGAKNVTLLGHHRRTWISCRAVPSPGC